MREQVVRDVKEEFLGATFGYLVKHGLENTSLRDLCKDTGISSGSIYYWFEGKDDVFINAAEYGLSKVADSIFEFAFDNMSDLKKFFDSSLDEISKHKSELRLIYQMATSPIYGGRMRIKAEELKIMYEKYTVQLSGILDIPKEELRPVVYMYISIILDYVVWEDYDNAVLQLDGLYSILTSKLEYAEMKIS